MAAENAKDERKATDTDEQFFYKTRKKAIGPFKKQLWRLPAEKRAKLARRTTPSSVPVPQLGVGGTQAMVGSSSSDGAAPSAADGCQHVHRGAG